MTMDEAREFCPGCNDNPKLWREDLCDECLAKCILLRGVTVEALRQAVDGISEVSNRLPSCVGEACCNGIDLASATRSMFLQVAEHFRKAGKSQ